MLVEFTVLGSTFKAEVNLEPYVPALTFGPPERCHPEEGGEVEFESIDMLDGDLFDFITDDAKNLIKKAAYLAAEETRKEEKEEAAVARYQSLFE